MATTKKVRFRNRHNGLRVIYDSTGRKVELVPGGTVFLEPSWAGRFRCLEKVEDTSSKPPKKEKKEVTEE